MDNEKMTDDRAAPRKQLRNARHSEHCSKTRRAVFICDRVENTPALYRTRWHTIAERDEALGANEVRAFESDAAAALDATAHPAVGSV